MQMSLAAAMLVLWHPYDQQMGQTAFERATGARVRAHSVTLDSSYAARLVGRAYAAVSTLPVEFRGTFEADLDRLSSGLTSASASHAKGDADTSKGDGMYSAIMLRISRDEWGGVAKASDDCTSVYMTAYSHYSTAGSGYGAVASLSRRIVSDVAYLQTYIDAMRDMFDF